MFSRGILGSIGIQFGVEGSKLLSLSESNVLLRTTPVWTALLVVFYLKSEKYSKFIFINSSFCMIGILFISQPPFLNNIFNRIGLAYK